MPNRDMFRLAFTEPKMSADNSEAEVLLYGAITENIPDDWKIDDEEKSASDFRKAIKNARDTGAGTLKLRINSPGGYVTEAVAMRAILADAGFEHVNIAIEGLCASAATIVATLPGAHVSIAPGSEYMIHNPRCMAWGTAGDLEKVIQHLRMEEHNSAAFYAKRTGKTEEECQALMDAETWFTAEEAVENGFADEVTKEEEAGEKLVASVSGRTLALMQSMYRQVPASLQVTEEMAAESDSNSDPTVAAGEETVNNHEEVSNMEIKDLTLEQLRAENPGLVESIMQSAATQERERVQDIDDLTPAGYEEMAAQAKADGTSSMDYHKAIIKAQREKAGRFLEDRKAETQQSANVQGGAAEDTVTNDEDEMKSFASEMAAIAKDMHVDFNGMH